MTTALKQPAVVSVSPSNPALSPGGHDDAYLQQFGLRLRVLRLARDLTQHQLADRVGMDRTYISRLERGHHNLTVLVLDRLAGALGVPCKELLPQRWTGGCTRR